MKNSSLVESFLKTKENSKVKSVLTAFENILRKISGQTTVSVGVDIGLDCLRLIKTMRASDNFPILLDFKNVALPAGLGKQSPEFEEFLRTALNQFCRGGKKPFLWAIMPTMHVNVRHICLPKAANLDVEKGVFWSLKKDKDNPFNEKESVLDFKVEGDVQEKGKPKLLVMVYTAPIKKVDEVKAMYARIGRPLTGLSITPFGIENILASGWVPNVEKTNAILFIGNNFSRIDIYYNGNLVLTRDIKTGAKSNVESIKSAFKYKVDSTQAAGGAEGPKIDDEQAMKLFASLSQDAPELTEDDLGYGLKEEEIFEMIKPALQRLVRQLERTFEHFDATIGTEKIDKIYISGVMNISQPVIEYLSGELGLKGGILDPLGTQVLCESVTNDYDRVSFIPAVGIALSDRINTPNLLFSHKDRVREALFNRVNLGVFACFIIAVAICFTMFLFKRSTVVKENSNLISLEQQYQQYNPRLSKELIIEMVTKIEKKQEVTNEYSERYYLVGIINELTALTPKEIRIVKINAMLGGIGIGLRGGKNGSDSKAIKIVDRGKDIRLEGFVHGEHFRLKTDLFDYVTKLRESTMFEQVRIQESKFASSKKDTVLYFVVSIDIG